MDKIKAKYNGCDEWVITVSNRFQIEVKAEVYSECGDIKVGLISRNFNDINADRIKESVMLYAKENESEFMGLFEPMENDNRFHNGLIDNY